MLKRSVDHIQAPRVDHIQPPEQAVGLNHPSRRLNKDVIQYDIITPILISYHQLQKFQNDFFVEVSPPLALLNSDCSTFPTPFPSDIKPISLSLSTLSHEDNWLVTLTSIMKREFHERRAVPVVDPFCSLRFNCSFHARRGRKSAVNHHTNKDIPHTVIKLNIPSLFSYQNRFVLLRYERCQFSFPWSNNFHAMYSHHYRPQFLLRNCSVICIIFSKHSSGDGRTCSI